MDFIKKYSNFILRGGLSLVFIWFGYKSFTNPQMFVSLVPTWTNFIAPTTLIKIHGTLEVVFGILLLVGWKIRLSAGVLLLTLFGTLFGLDYGPTMVRDVGLWLALLSVFGRNE
jgi:uncharacterized membrane protein YphA (DoxX/SURF4 family)